MSHLLAACEHVLTYGTIQPVGSLSVVALTVIILVTGPMTFAVTAAIGYWVPMGYVRAAGGGGGSTAACSDQLTSATWVVLVTQIWAYFQQWPAALSVNVYTRPVSSPPCLRHRPRPRSAVRLPPRPVSRLSGCVCL